MITLKDRISKNSYIYLGSLISLLILIIIVFLFPVEFSGYKTTDVLAPIWFGITQTGGWMGGIYIFLILIFYLLIHFKRSSKKYSDLLFFISLVFFTQVFITGFSQFYAKDLFRKPRPNQIYLMEKGYMEKKGAEFFSMPSGERRKYLQETIKHSDDSLIDIYPPILDSWINDSGFSFPSGHSQTSFFLGTIIAFAIFKTARGKKKYFFIIPFIWAILVALSRVVIGIHYPVDVSAGAFVGISAAVVILSLKKTNNIFE